MFKIVIALLIALPISLFSQVFRGQMLPENSEFIETSSVTLVKQDSKGRVWVYSGGEKNLWLRDKGVWTKAYNGIQAPGELLEDKYGNILIPTYENLFVYKNDGTTQIIDKGMVEWLTSACIVDTSVYFSNILLGLNRLPEVSYNRATNSYDLAQHLEFDDSVEIHAPYGVVEKNKEIYYVCDQGLFVYHTLNKSYRIVSHPELDFFNISAITYSKDNPKSGGMCVDSNGVITILVTKDKKPTVIRIYSDDSIKTFVYPYFISKAISDGNRGIDSHIYPVNDSKTEFLFGVSFDLLYFSEETGIKYIPRPSEVPMSQWACIRSMSIVDGDEIWFGSIGGGIIRCGLKELLATKTDQPTAAVEDIVPYIAMMDIYSVYPQPAAQYVDIDYFLQTCNFSENIIKIYDTYGQEISKFRFEVLREKGMMRTLRIHTEGFSSGGYAIEINDGDNRATGKFLIK